MAKSRFAPINRSTIALLELQAALVGEKLVALAKTELGNQFPVKIFSDCMGICAVSFKPSRIVDK